jgi:DNA-binding XRE family transcriptional regulator
MSLGTRIMRVRNQKGITQRELGERSGIASSYLSRIENRHLEPRPKTLQKIAKALGVPVSDFFEERTSESKVPQCVITPSGNCVMDLLRAGRGKPPTPGAESYSPRQLQLLRMAGYLVQTGDARLLDTLDVVLGALLDADRKKASQPRPAILGPSGKNPSSPA